MGYYDDNSFNELKGKVLSDVRVLEDEVIFETKEGDTYRLYHSQDCCESVYVESVVGDIADLLDTEILLAEEVNNVDEKPKYDFTESYTWTFYKLATIKGSVTIRFYGSSNGYYSESVSFSKV